MQGIQNVILNIIKTCRKKELDLPYITKQGIIDEAKKTPLITYADKYHVGDKKTMLERKVDQALYQLKIKGKIRQTKSGHWAYVNKPKKYEPIVCKALQYEYETHCPKCNTYKYEKSTKKEVLGKKCPECEKGRTTISFFRYYCPVRKTYIGDPVKQCELLHPTGIGNDGNKVLAYPMKNCYFGHKPKDLEIADMQRMVREEKETEQKDLEAYLSKYHLPRPVAKEGQ